VKSYHFIRVGGRGLSCGNRRSCGLRYHGGLAQVV
jgi:hypothetical protein